MEMNESRCIAQSDGQVRNQMQNKQNWAKPKHVVDDEMLHTTTQDAVGLVKTITSPLPPLRFYRRFYRYYNNKVSSFEPGS
ncbi:hypothetical protein Tco_1460448 [Tanacetum coccineum]